MQCSGLNFHLNISGQQREKVTKTERLSQRHTEALKGKRTKSKRGKNREMVRKQADEQKDG